MSQDDSSKPHPMQVRAAKLCALDRLMARYLDKQFEGKEIPRRLQWPSEFIPSVCDQWFGRGRTMSEKQCNIIDRLYMECDLEEDFDADKTWPYFLQDKRVLNVKPE